MLGPYRAVKEAGIGDGKGGKQRLSRVAGYQGRCRHHVYRAIVGGHVFGPSLDGSPQNENTPSFFGEQHMYATMHAHTHTHTHTHTVNHGHTSF
jgi:hypothetical protein